MAIELEKGSLNINQIIAQKYESDVIDGDCIVPDTKPDILGIIETSGVISIYKKEVLDGKVRIEGSVNAYVMYLGDDGKTKTARSISHSLDFSQIINVDNATIEMLLMSNSSLQKIECKVINERKLSIQATVNHNIKIFTNSNVEFINNANISDMQKLENTVTVNSLVGSGNSKSNAKETIQIDKTENLAEIMKVNTEIINKDIKISYNKILTKADVRIKILYSTEEGRINSVSKTIPMVGFIDMQGINEKNLCDTEMEINNIIIKPNSTQDHSIYVELEMEMMAITYETKEINVIQDLYSPSMNLEFEQTNIKAIQNKAKFEGKFNINQTETLNIGDEKVYDVDSRIFINDAKSFNDECDISGTVTCTFIHSINSMTGISINRIDIPFEYKMPCTGILANSQMNISYELENDDFNIMPGGDVDVNLNINFSIESSNEINISMINNITESKTNSQNDYNMVIYFTKSDDSLWNIAKRFKSTTDIIINENSIENESILPGTQLFISKYIGANG